MTKILNHINTYADLTAYNNDTNKDYPNVSYIQASDEVKWNKYDPEHIVIVAVYNVTSTSDATKLLGSSTNITYQIIDGVQQDTVQTTYTFDTLGEHIVKYTLTDNTEVGENMFLNCIKLTSVTIPNTLTSIGNNAFQGCNKLTSVTISEGVTSIGNSAFYFCTSLTSITVETTTPPSLGSSAFGTTNNCPIYVPAESVDAYKAATNWSSYASRIQPIS